MPLEAVEEFAKRPVVGKKLKVWHSRGSSAKPHASTGVVTKVFPDGSVFVDIPKVGLVKVREQERTKVGKTSWFVTRLEAPGTAQKIKAAVGRAKGVPLAEILTSDRR